MLLMFLILTKFTLHAMLPKFQNKIISSNLEKNLYCERYPAVWRTPNPNKPHSFLDSMSVHFYSTELGSEIKLTFRLKYAPYEVQLVDGF